MKICSVCLKCYDDSIAKCAVEGHGSLIQARHGNCLISEDYRIDSRFESASPVELFRATHLESKKTVLISFIERDNSSSGLEDELRAFVGLVHPNLPGFFEFGKVDKKELFIIQEEPTGQSLYRYLADSTPFTERQSIEIVRQVAEGLDVLHAAGLVHGAVNPANIYFTSPEAGDYPVKLCNYDFGGIIRRTLAASANGIEAEINSLRYFSPEQFTSNDLDFRSDLYSLAGVFYHLLLGRPAIGRPDAESVSNYVFDQSDVWGLHLDLRALLAHTLKQSFQRRLELRPPTTGNFVRQLRHLELISTRLNTDSSLLRVDQPKDDQPFKAYRPHLPVEPEKRDSEEHDVRGNETAGDQTVDSLAGSIPSPVSRHEDTNGSESAGYKIHEIETEYVDDGVQVIGSTFDENSEPLDIISEPFRLDEPGFIDKTGERLTESRRLSGVPGNYLRSKGSSAFLLSAGLLFAAVFGGVMTATVLELQRNVSPANTARPEKTVEEKQSTPSPEQSAEITDADTTDSDEQEDPEIPDQNRRELDQVVDLISSAETPEGLPTARPSKPTQVATRKPKRPSKGKRNKSRKNQEQNGNADGVKRPLFKTVVIYY